MDREELAGWLRLTLVRGVGNEAARRLLAAFGLPDAVFAQPEAALREVVSAAQARALLQPPDGWAALVDATDGWLRADDAQGHARRVLTLADGDYPATLLATDDPPLLLYLLGNEKYIRKVPPAQVPPGQAAIKTEAFPAQHCLAIVGSRNPTPQGEDNALQFARAFAAAGLTVVSGLALGVDGAAHEGALQGAAQRTGTGPDRPTTIAVVGTGLDRVYPRKHLALAHRIASQGLLVSEYPLGTPPLAANFPKRNRIISGLSQGTLVVEAALASGSLITARMALEHNREVFAIPGSIHAPQSRGCHALIRQGAKLVESAQDVLEELRLAPPTPPGRTDPISEAADGDSDGDGDRVDRSSDDDDGGGGGGGAHLAAETALLRALGFDPVGLDALVARTGIGAAALQVQLLEHELDGSVARLPGGLFQRIGRA